MWILFTFGSAFFAGITAILGKIGIEGAESNLGTTIHTSVVLLMALLLVFAKGKQHTVKEVSPKMNLPTYAFQALRQAVRGYVTIRPCKTVLQVQLCRLIS